MCGPRNGHGRRSTQKTAPPATTNAARPDAVQGAAAAPAAARPVDPTSEPASSAKPIETEAPQPRLAPPSPRHRDGGSHVASSAPRIDSAPARIHATSLHSAPTLGPGAARGAHSVPVRARAGRRPTPRQRESRGAGLARIADGGDRAPLRPFCGRRPPASTFWPQAGTRSSPHTQPRAAICPDP